MAWYLIVSGLFLSIFPSDHLVRGFERYRFHVKLTKQKAKCVVETIHLPCHGIGHI